MKPSASMPLLMLLMLLTAGCAADRTSRGPPLASRCGINDCFVQREIRDFELVTPETLVVFVGEERCPFLVSVDSSSCDVGLAPQVQFLERSLDRVDRATPVTSAQICPTTRGLLLFAGIGAPELAQPVEATPGAVAAETAGAAGVPAGPSFGGPSFAIDLGSNDVCVVRDVRGINDDQLIELYVEQGIAAGPPPIGSGELDVPEQPSPSGQAAPSETELEPVPQGEPDGEPNLS